MMRFLLFRFPWYIIFAYIVFMILGFLWWNTMPPQIQVYVTVILSVILILHVVWFRLNIWDSSIREAIKINWITIFLFTIPFFLYFSANLSAYHEIKFSRCWNVCSTELLDDLSYFFENDSKKYGYHLIYNAPETYFNDIVWTWHGTMYKKWSLNTWDEQLLFSGIKDRFAITKNETGKYELFTAEYTYIATSDGKIGALKNQYDDYIFPLEEWLMFIDFAAPPYARAWSRDFYKKSK